MSLGNRVQEEGEKVVGEKRDGATQIRETQRNVDTKTTGKDTLGSKRERDSLRMFLLILWPYGPLRLHS